MPSSRVFPLLLVLVFVLGFASARLSARSGPVEARSGNPLTDSLVADLNGAWNSMDLSELASRLQPNAFFKSPYQLRYGREEMLETVLKTNPPVFRDVRSDELHAEVVGDFLAWSMGETHSDIYQNGQPTGEVGNADYLYVFTPDDMGAWKTQMMIYHEACE